MRIYKHQQHNASLFGGEAGIDVNSIFLTNIDFKSTFSAVFGENLELNEPLSLIPSHKWNNEFTCLIKEKLFLDNIILKGTYSYHFKQDKIALEETITNTYSLINVSIGGTKRNHNFSFHIQNLLNTAYIPHLSLLKENGIFEAGRNIAFKYSVSF